MPEADIATEDLEGRIAQLGSADVAVGIPTFNDAKTIDPIVGAVTAWLDGLAGVRAVIIHADAGSTDGTVLRARASANLRSNFLQWQPGADGGLPRGRSAPPPAAAAMRAVFHLARRLGVRTCAVVDASALGLASNWIPRLLEPVRSGQADLVAPYYVRRPFSGSITSGIVYPAVRALFGKRIRHPMARDFAASADLLDYHLRQDLWTADLPPFGTGLRLTTDTLAGGFRVAQAWLGPKSPVGGDAAGGLSETLSGVLRSLFLSIERDVSVWQKIRGSEPVAILGAPDPDAGDAVEVDAQWALASFRLGQENLREVWGSILPPITLVELRRLARRSDAGVRFPDPLWARIVYDFALAFHARRMNRDHLMAAFTPLYLGWLGSFVLEMSGAGEAEVERRVEQLCLQYEAEKPYLISRWRWPDRFNP